MAKALAFVYGLTRTGPGGCQVELHAIVDTTGEVIGVSVPITFANSNATKLAAIKTAVVNAYATPQYVEQTVVLANSDVTLWGGIV